MYNGFDYTLMLFVSACLWLIVLLVGDASMFGALCVIEWHKPKLSKHQISSV